MTLPEPAISTILAEMLATNRAHCNARVAEARHRDANFDTTAFSSFMRTGLDSIVRSLKTVTPALPSERITFAVLAAYDMAIELVAQNLAGPNARTDVVNRVWESLAPRYTTLIAAEPISVLGALSNAAIHIANVANARVDEWLSNMGEMAQQVDSLPTLHRVGQVLAWRAGLAHFREGALLSAASLPLALATHVVGAASTQDWPTLHGQFSENPWFAPSNVTTHPGWEIGEFTGFGGSFAKPPEVRAYAQGFIVRSADRFNFLIADAYGAVLLPATAEEFSNAPDTRDVRITDVKLAGSQLSIKGRHVDLDLPECGLAIVANQHTVAVTSRYTHAIRLLPFLLPFA
jgi:hypothetical protein